jgi:hypothetical protein
MLSFGGGIYWCRDAVLSAGYPEEAGYCSAGGGIQPLDAVALTAGAVFVAEKWNDDVTVEG